MSPEIEQERKAAAKAAMEYINGHTIIGVGTGGTTNFFIEELASIKNKIEGAVASSVATEKFEADVFISYLLLPTLSAG